MKRHDKWQMEEREKEAAFMRAALLVVMLATYGICIPLYKKVNPKGLPGYLVWLLLIGAVWVFVVIPALAGESLG